MSHKEHETRAQLLLLPTKLELNVLYDLLPVEPVQIELMPTRHSLVVVVLEDDLSGLLEQLLTQWIVVWYSACAIAQCLRLSRNILILNG